MIPLFNSNGLPLRIHISEPTRDALKKLGGYVIEDRGLIEMKGKGEVPTYWLISASNTAVKRRMLPKTSITCKKSPLFHGDGEGELRKRSSRLSSDLRRFSLGGRSSLARYLSVF